MLTISVWRRLLGVCHRTIIERVSFDEDRGVVVADVRPRSSWKPRCGRCGRVAPRYDRGDPERGAREWRTVDLGPVKAVLRCRLGRVSCPEHGPTVVAVPWARHDAGHTRAFDETVAWLVTQCSKQAVRQLMRVAWETVGGIITRVMADLDAQVDRLDGLRRIGIDEISYKRGHKYLTVVVDHDTGRLVWAKAGADQATLNAFFDLLGDERAAQITHVSADGADWIARVVARRCPNAVRCADPFHIVMLAMEALDEVRRQSWNRARGGRNQSNSVRANSRHRKPNEYKKIKGALLKAPENLSARQTAQIEWLVKNDPQLHRAYLLKEGLRHVFALEGQDAKDHLDAWLGWASRSQIPAFIELAKKIRRQRSAIEACIDHDLSNARTEGVNTRIRLITRRAFGFRSPDALIALAMLSLGGYHLELPGRI